MCIYFIVCFSVWLNHQHIAQLSESALRWLLLFNKDLLMSSYCDFAFSYFLPLQTSSNMTTCLLHVMSIDMTCYPETSLYYQYSQSDLLRLSESLAHLPFLALSCSFSLYGLTMCSLTTRAIILLYNNSWSHWTLQLLLSEPMKVFFTQRNIYIICKLRNVV